MRSKKLLYNIITSIILNILMLINGFVVSHVVISAFGSSVNGLIASISRFLAYIVFLECGLGPVVKAALYKPIAEKDTNTITRILKSSEKFFRIIGLIFLFYIFLLCFFYPFLIKENFTKLYIISLILIISFSTFCEYYFCTTYNLFLQACQDNHVIHIVRIISYIISIAVIIVLSSLGTSIHVIKLVGALIFIFKPLFLNYYVKKKYKISLKNNVGNYELSNRWDAFAQHVAYVIHTNTDVVVLTIFRGLIDVSIYSVYGLVIKGIESLINSITSGIDATFGDMIARGENENLNKKFSMFEILFNTISTIVFSSAIVLIVPFVSVYTKNITDANYINYSFGILLVISEFIWAIRQPYNYIILSAGHFKEIRVGAWVECVSNLAISIILVIKFGLVGVTIGTIVAMTIRTIEFVYHTNKYILGRSMWDSIEKFLLIIVETLIIVFICRYLPYVNNVSYFNWIKNAIMIFILSCIVTIFLNLLYFRYEFKKIINIFIEWMKKIKWF